MLKESIPSINYNHFSSKFPNSRYRSDFDEIQKIGRGGGGHVYQVRNRLDNLIYAVKKVKLDSSYHAQKENDRILREVALLSRLQNQYIVRYYQAWIEDIEDGESSEKDGSSITEESANEEGQESEDELDQREARSTSSIDFTNSRIEPSGRPKYFDPGMSDSDDSDIEFMEADEEFKFSKQHSNKSETIVSKIKLMKSKQAKKGTKDKDEKRRKLYIQMEYCEKDTLRSLIEKGINDHDDIWKYMEQILKAFTLYTQYGTTS